MPRSDDCGIEDAVFDRVDAAIRTAWGEPRGRTHYPSSRADVREYTQYQIPMDEVGDFIADVLIFVAPKGSLDVD